MIDGVKLSKSDEPIFKTTDGYNVVNHMGRLRKKMIDGET